MSSSNDDLGGPSPVLIINLGIWIPIVIMVFAYFSCSSQYRCCKNVKNGRWCCDIRNGDDIDRGRDHAIMMQEQSGNPQPLQNIYSITNAHTLSAAREQLQHWYDNFETHRSNDNNGARSSNLQSVSGVRNSGRETPPPSYDSLFSSIGNVIIVPAITKPT